MPEDDAMYKMPPIDATPFSLMLWSQFGFFLLMLYETTVNSSGDGNDLFGMTFVIVGLLLLLRVKNGVLGAMGVLAAAPVVFGLIDGAEMNEMIGGIFWLVIFMGGMGVMLPATGFKEYGLEISDGARKWVVIFVVCLVAGMFGAGESYDIASSGEYTSDSGDETHVADDLNVNIAWAGFAVAVVGLLILLVTAAGGVEIGPLRPFHGVAIAVLSAWLSAYNLSDFAGRDLPVELAWALVISGLMVLPVYNFFDNDAA